MEGLIKNKGLICMEGEMREGYRSVQALFFLVDKVYTVL